MRRADLTPAERRRRSQLARLVSYAGLLRGSLVVRQRVCGHPNCRCARGDKHRALYLTSYQEGQSRQLYIPRDKEDLAKEWVQNLQQARDLLDQLTELCWRRLKGG